jgi:hypothetical protein
VAIVDADDDHHAELDLGTYRAQFGIAACTTANGCFRKVDQTGGSSYPSPDPGWAGDQSRPEHGVGDLSPRPHPVDRAGSAPIIDLGTAENKAATLGANAISNS